MGEHHNDIEQSDEVEQLVAATEEEDENASPEDVSLDEHIEEHRETAEEALEEDLPTEENYWAYLIEGQQTLAQHLQRLQEDFVTKMMYDKHKEEMVDRLYAELQENKGLLKFKLIEPLMNDLWTLYSDLHRLTQLVLENPEASEDLQRFARNVATFCEDIEAMLARYGVELYEVPDNIFDGKWQRVERVEYTEDPHLDHTVAARTRKGIRRGDHILQRESVVIYRCISSPEPTEPEPTD